MTDLNFSERFAKLAIQIPQVLLPKAGVDYGKWAVIACDQYTSEPEYWKKVESIVAGAPSTLSLIFPEVNLEQADKELSVEKINTAMSQYLNDGTLVEQAPGFVLVDRSTKDTVSRKGLMVALDLEAYSFDKSSQTLIRATEGTVMDRLPPRIKIRENAPVEVPHIMVLIDDPQKTVIEPLFNEDLPVLYDTDLMLGGGHVKGYHVTEPRLWEQIAQALEALAEPSGFKQKYHLTSIQEQPVMLYAMGDGNHSFATAKAIWEKLKAEATDKQAIMNHPARYGLVELVNIHDSGLNFEPIHRVLFNVDASQVLASMDQFFQQKGTKVELEVANNAEDALKNTQGTQGQDQALPFISTVKSGSAILVQPKLNLPVANLQQFIDSYLEENPKVKVDYIHGRDAVVGLGQKPGNMGFYLPPMAKSELFRTVILDGALPRKTFSMGEADEKRYYLECRKITDDSDSVDR